MFIQSEHPKCEYCECAASMDAKHGSGAGTLCPFHLGSGFPDTTECPHCKPGTVLPYGLRTHKIIGGKPVPLVPFDITTDGTGPAMLRFSRAIALYQGRISDSIMFPPFPAPESNNWRGHSVWWRVFIPECYIEAFKAYARPFEMKPPPKVSVGGMRTR